MPSPSQEDEDPNLYGEDDDVEDVDDDVDESEEDDEEDEEEEGTRRQDLEEDLNSGSPSTSSSSETNNNADPNPVTADSKPAIAAENGTFETPPSVAISFPDVKRQRISTVDDKKPTPVAASDDSRRLFQRLWTDEDEIGLLQGFLDYTSQRDPSQHHHHDTGPFYDQIKTRLQLDFNKNQLVEKLRRLKKKYRNVVNRIGSGKEFSFKSPHDQATFEISRKIWSERRIEEGGLEEDERNLQNNNTNNNNHNNTNSFSVANNSSEKKVPRSRRRSRKRSAEEDLSKFPTSSSPPSIPNLIEETVKSCLSPLFKELLYCALNGPSNSSGYGGGIALNPLPLNFGGSFGNSMSSGMVDEKWRKQQILELEVYSKRIELVQDQIKSALEDLKSLGSS
eukprot:TRINITY_DN5396_c0_g1_i1.p1 TRINITY_DN5396_c0_g1~~TRINITY_DN5396_c0_g1_i1.p1  ORF type:complete len:412 (-),score=69.59 TRINITY_DN5396_c0_g1_i1:193-1374(-)